jgi:hypothetical protein
MFDKDDDGMTPCNGSEWHEIPCGGSRRHRKQSIPRKKCVWRIGVEGVTRVGLEDLLGICCLRVFLR